MGSSPSGRSSTSAPARRIPPGLEHAAGVAWRVLLIGAAALAVILLVGRLRLVLIPLAFALFFTALLEPVPRWLRRHRVPGALAAAITVALALAAVAGVVVLAGVRLSSELDALVDSLSRGWDRLVAWLAGVLPASEQEIRSAIRSAGRSLGGGDFGTTVFGGAVTAVHVVVMTVLSIVFVFFFLKDGEEIAGWAAERTGGARGERLREVSRSAWSQVAAYARGQSLIAAIDAVLTGIALLVIGVPLVLTLTLLTLVGGFVPLAGPVVAAVAASLVALSDGGLGDAVWVIVAAVAIQQAEGNFLQPYILGRALRLHPLVVIVAVTVGGIVGGVVGAFVAVPLTSAGVVVVSRYRDAGAERPRAPAAEGRAA